MVRTITVHQPFNLALSLEMGQAIRWRRVGDERVHRQDWADSTPSWRESSGSWYSGVLGEYLVHLRQFGNVLEYRVGGRSGERHDVNLDRQIHDYFRLGDDIASVYDQLGRHRALASAMRRYPGLRLLRQDPWECLVPHMCSGTDGIRGIRQCIERIAQLSRRKVFLDDDERYLFPGPGQIAEQGEGALADLELGLSSGPRKIFLIGTHLSRDPLLLELREATHISTTEAMKLLGSYRGIGPKIAGCVALMSLDKLDAFPVDRWVRRALDVCDLSTMPAGLAERVRNSRPLTEFRQYQVAEWAREYFGEYAGYANQYLYHWVEPHKERVGGNRICLICDAGPGDVVRP